MFKRGKTSMVGVDIGSSSVKAVELQGKGADLQLLSLGFESLQQFTVFLHIGERNKLGSHRMRLNLDRQGARNPSAFPLD